MKKVYAKQLTRKQLEEELHLARDTTRHYKDIADKMMVQNEILRTKILENTQIQLRNQGLKMALSRIPNSDRLCLQIEISSEVYSYHDPEYYCESIAQQVKHEFLKKWPRLAISV